MAGGLSLPQHHRRPVAGAVLWVALGLALIAAVLLTAGRTAAYTSDTISVFQSASPPSNVDLALAMRAVTPQDTETVLIARDDDFADALASGVLQTGAPLYLVPTQGPLPSGVLDAIRAADASRAIVLGGLAAVGQAVTDELTGMGLAVQRRAGDSRITTAIEVAERDASQADTVILARAFADPATGDPSQAYADAVAAGALAARTGWPILLTQSDQISRPTADYLEQRQPQQVYIAGGTSAVSATAEAQVDAVAGRVTRMAGDTRAETAVAIAAVAGNPDSTTAPRVIVTDGQSGDAWAGGLLAANHAAVFNAPVVLTPNGQIPPATAAFLEDGIAGDGDQPVLTCVVAPEVCEGVRDAVGLLDRGPLVITPAGGTLAAGETVIVSTRDDDGTITVDGTCVEEPATVGSGGEVVAAPPAEGACTVVATRGGDTAVAVFNPTAADVPIPAVPISVAGGGAVELIFAAEADAEVTVSGAVATATGCPTIELLSPGGATLRTIALVEDCALEDNVVGPGFPAQLPTAGVYRARATVPPEATAELTVTVAHVRTAEIAPEDDAVTHTVTEPGAATAYRFTGQAGDLITFGVTNATVSACERILLFADNGVFLDGIPPIRGCDIEQHRADAGGAVRLPLDGGYTLLTTIAGDGTGSFDLTLLGVPEVPVSVDGPDVEVDIDRPSRHVLHTFEGEAGDRVSFAVTGANVQDCEEVLLLTPELDVLDRISPENNCTVAGHRADAGNPRTLPRSGTYTLLTAIEQGGTGTFDVVLTAPREGQIVPNGPALTADIDRPGRAVILAFEGEAGQQVRFTTSDVDANDCEVVTLFSPAFELIGTVAPTAGCGSGNDGTASEAIDLELDGSYLLVAKLSAGGTGRFRVAVEAS